MESAYLPHGKCLSASWEMPICLMGNAPVRGLWLKVGEADDGGIGGIADFGGEVVEAVETLVVV